VLLSAFPHTVAVDSPTYGTDAASGGNTVTWAEVNSAVPCQVTAAGGTVTDAFGGRKMIRSATLSTTSDVLRHGYRVRWVPPGESDSYYFVTDGGAGTRVAAIGNVPTFFTWTLRGVTGSA
jgi:hypothetical protein